jgi:hypothetical protein
MRFALRKEATRWLRRFIAPCAIKDYFLYEDVA